MSFLFDSAVRAPRAKVRTVHMPPEERVLNVPELLNIILSFLEKAHVLECALVSKSWSVVALDVLWRVMDRASDLLGMLGEMGAIAGDDEMVRQVCLFKYPLTYSANLVALWRTGTKCMGTPRAVCTACADFHLRRGTRGRNRHRRCLGCRRTNTNHSSLPT